jgi:hypothetical protein
METPGGNVTDTASIEKGSLVLLTRKLTQGPVNIDLAFAGGKATGNVSMNGTDKVVAADLGGSLFADSAAAEQVLACLPLADGYTTTFRNFDIQTQKVKLYQLKVAGVEKITVPAGSFDAFRLDINSADGGPDKRTVWIARDSHKVVKVSAVLPSMGGATMTEELAE